jgi:hypothetical protein
MRYELTYDERTAIEPMLPNKPLDMLWANDVPFILAFGVLFLRLHHLPDHIAYKVKNYSTKSLPSWGCLPVFPCECLLDRRLAANIDRSSRFRRSS